MRILLIASFGSTLVSRLGDIWFSVTLAGDTAEALSLLRQASYDLVLLDMSASAADGLDLIRRVRQSGDDTPLLALTGTAAGERATALQYGADDALAEPVDASELRSRIAAITRPDEDGIQPAVRLGDLSLNLVAREARFGGVHVPLSPKEFALLELMVTRSGTAVTKAAMLAHLYGKRDEPDVQIDLFVSMLRMKLERAGAWGFIGTVWGEGYMIRDAALPRHKGAGRGRQPIHRPPIESSAGITASQRRNWPLKERFDAFPTGSAGSVGRFGGR